MIDRILKNKLLHFASMYPIVTVTGPRQSGKSTLIKSTFHDYRYVSLEEPDMREFATSDPRGFLTTFTDKTIIDEAQRVPSLFSYIQSIIDEKNNAGMYVLAGSHNFLLMEAINQSLAGRTAILKLLPLSHNEMIRGGIHFEDLNEEIFKGSYPRIYDKNLDCWDFYQFYIETYVQRDVRLIKNIGNLDTFIKFLKLSAGRIGQLLNMSSLANDCGVSVGTITQWLSILEASYVCYTLKPEHAKYSKRLVKTPKLYFFDTGLACSLLGIRSVDQLETHFLRGGLFENFMINEFIKRSFNSVEEPQLMFWRNSQGDEVDLVDYSGSHVQCYELKSSTTFNPEFFKGLTKWASLQSSNNFELNCLYGGDKSMTTSQGNVFGWKTFLENTFP